MILLPMRPGFVPRPWQQRAYEATRYAMLDPAGPQWQSGVINAATGTGKGDLIAGLAVAHALKGGRPMVVVDRRELVNDVARRTAEVAAGHGLVNAVGVCMERRNEVLAPIVVASIQSVSQPERLAALGWRSLLITDEAHGAVAPSHRALHAALAEKFPRWKHIGCTATGYRGDGSIGLGDVFDGEIMSYSIADAIEAGDLVPIEDWAIPTEVSIEHVASEGGDYDEDELADTVNVPERNRLAWQEYMKHAAGKPALFFACNVKHAHALAEMGRKEFGINAQAVHGPNKEFPLNPRECERLVREYKEHPEKLPVLCSCDLIRVGFDAPRTYAVVSCRPTKSLVVFVQMLGRGTRTVGVPPTLTDPAAKKAAIAASVKPKMVFLQLVDAGCDMTLTKATNLSKASADEEDRGLDVGDQVERRRHTEWGIGTIERVVTEDGPIGRVVAVTWPVSASNPAGGEREHPVKDLRRPVKAKKPKEEAKVVVLAFETGAAYRLNLLPDERVDDPTAIGWFEWQGTFTVGGFVQGLGRIKMHVRQAKGGAWEVWSLRPPIADRGEPDGDDIATRKRDDCESAVVARAWANSHLRAHHAQIAPLDAPWKSRPATNGMKGKLRSFDIKRDLDGMTEGEAMALLDALSANRRVKELLDPGLANRRKFAKAAYRGRPRASA